MTAWSKVLELDERREPVWGSAAALTAAVELGADLRVATAFRHNEHIDTRSSNDELIREHMDFRVTYVVAGSWTAAIETLRMPVSLPDGFGPRPSWSFFLYNQDGNQAIARPFLEGNPADQPVTSVAPGHDQAMPRLRVLSEEATDTNAPNHHFLYDFDYYQFWVCDRWREVLAHDRDGRVQRGSYHDLIAAVESGRELKVGIAGLCDDLGGGLHHEVFVHVGPCYEYTRTGFLVAATHPVVRVRAAIPLIYHQSAWDFGSLVVRTDGHVARWLCNPYTLRFAKSETRHSLRWFVDR